MSSFAKRKPLFPFFFRTPFFGTPCLSWCPSYIQARGRPDRHEAAQAKDVEREIPCLSFDFAYTAYSENPAEQKLCCLVVHDSTTHAVRAFPIKQKHESLHHMAAEVTRFAVFLGHHEISLRCDAEPVLLKLQGMIQRIRLKQG